jgi:Xaa-Pro aminopeptidase
VNSTIKTFLDQNDLDGFFYVADSICNADMYYLSGFLAGDRFALLAQEKTTILVSSMETGRAQKESKADKCMSTSEYNIIELLKDGKKPNDAYVQVLAEFLRDNRIKNLGIPQSFPAGVYEHLRQHFNIKIIESPAARLRMIKSPDEQEAIAASQRACERAMRRAVQLVSGSEPRGDVLYRSDEPLTSEMVRGAIEVSLLEDGCEAADTIVAGGRQASDPHMRGTGPLPANLPIVIDIFPRSKISRYFADMTRTVLRGEASLEAAEMYEAVRLAQDAGLKAIRARVDGSEVHFRVSQVFTDQGYPEREGRGFTHSTGHGVGLDVHERPSISEVGEILEDSAVVTVEPGLYYPEIGGVRLEDLVVVKESGSKNLTHFERQLVI